MISFSFICYFSCVKPKHSGLKLLVYTNGSGPVGGSFTSQISLGSRSMCPLRLQSYLTKLKESLDFPRQTSGTLNFCFLYSEQYGKRIYTRKKYARYKEASEPRHLAINPSPLPFNSCVNVGRTHHFPKPSFLHLVENKHLLHRFVLRIK